MDYVFIALLTLWVLAVLTLIGLILYQVACLFSLYFKIRVWRSRFRLWRSRVNAKIIKLRYPYLYVIKIYGPITPKRVEEIENWIVETGLNFKHFWFNINMDFDLEVRCKNKDELTMLVMKWS